MIIPVELAIEERPEQKLPPQFAQFGTDEVVLVELQGALEVEGEMKGQFVGKLSVDDESKKPSLLIGHHLLEGKLVSLPKPFAVMKRVPPEFMDSDDLNDESHATSSNAPPPTWKIVAVVKRKMVFAKRPMPMVGKTNATLDTGKTTQR